MLNPHYSTVLSLLADETRLRIAAATVLGGGTTDDIAACAGVTKRRALEAGPREEPGDVVGVDRETASVLRAFLRGGRLTQIPAQRSKRLVVLDHISRVFDVGVRYPEREVNAFLRAFHPDVAALRRYLVDEGFMSRERNVYWRTGGSVDV